ncbi:MAG: hypothetical protein COA41_20480 [Sphingopyxis sp.]|nr:MAG: hypothetical protein COA41_20480 [Sphingopyxis sp.]
MPTPENFAVDISYLKLSLLATGIVISGCSGANGDLTYDGATSSSSHTDQSFDADEFWTQERQKAAVEPQLNEQAKLTLPDDAFEDSKSAAYERANAAAPPVEVDTIEWPYNTVGKVFSVRADGSMTVCTGQVMAPTKTVVMTAAHCLVDAKLIWGKKRTFILGAGGPNPQVFETDCAIRFTDFRYGQSWRTVAADIAFLRLKRPAPKALGVTTPPERVLESLGYPAGYKGGAVPVKVQGMRGPISRKRRVVALATHPKMDRGASGGAWLFGPNIVGMNSQNNGRGYMLGPLITQNVIDLHKYLRDPSTCVTRFNHPIRSGA